MSKATTVILCGGFANNGPNKAALALLDSKKSCRYLLAALEEVKRCQPLSAGVFWVINESDKDAFMTGPNSLLSEIAGYGFSDLNFISNGATSAADWKGEIADLKLALSTLGTDKPVLAISGALTLSPGFNLQRLVEHCFIRGQDTLGYSLLSDADVALLGPEHYNLIQIARNEPLPPLSAISPAGSDSQPCIGEPAADRLLMLRPSTASSLAVMESTASGLIELASELLSKGIKVHGVELGVGRLRLENVPCVSYADQFIHYLKQRMHPCKGLGEGIEETMGSTHRALSGIFDDQTRMAEGMAEFESTHFGWQTVAEAEIAMSGQATMREYYRLPSTFYMTTYRRACAELMK